MMIETLIPAEKTDHPNDHASVRLNTVVGCNTFCPYPELYPYPRTRETPLFDPQHLIKSRSNDVSHPQLKKGFDLVWRYINGQIFFDNFQREAQRNEFEQAKLAEKDKRFINQFYNINQIRPDVIQIGMSGLMYLQLAYSRMAGSDCVDYIDQSRRKLVEKIRDMPSKSMSKNDKNPIFLIGDNTPVEVFRTEQITFVQDIVDQLVEVNNEIVRPFTNADDILIVDIT
jgi:hypothetical protein